MYICDCGKTFEDPQQFNGHKCHCEQHFLKKYGSLEKFELIKLRSKETVKEAGKIYIEKCNKIKQDELLLWISEKHTCEKCGKVMIEKYGSGRFCCRACSNTRALTDETKKKIVASYNVKLQDTMEKYLLNPNYCSVCGKMLPYENRHRKTCSKNCKSICLQAAGKHAASTNIKTRRSKNEVYFCELCEKYFNTVIHNIPMFNGWDADVIIEDIKYAVLWNGPWHYREIIPGTSLIQIQNRDKIKINEIKIAGYTPYIIKDGGKFDKLFVENQFNLFIETITNLHSGSMV